MKWASVKSVHRAVEKLVRVYQQVPTSAAIFENTSNDQLRSLGLKLR